MTKELNLNNTEKAIILTLLACRKREIIKILAYCESHPGGDTISEFKELEKDLIIINDLTNKLLMED